jgi:hypothetical protein
MKLDKQPYEMTANEFTGKFYQHGNLRAQTPEAAAEIRKKIQEEGFKSEYPNVIPPVAQNPSDVFSKRYTTKIGVDYYIVPKNEVESGRNGNRIRDGWKPTSDQIIQVRYDGQPIHEALIERAISEGKLDLGSKIGRRVLTDYPDLQKRFANSSPRTLITTPSLQVTNIK